MPSLNTLFVGEAMVEFSRRQEGGWNQGFAGDTLNVAWAMRSLWAGDAARISYVTRIGDDPFSEQFQNFLAASGIGADHISVDQGKTIGLYTIETDDEGERSFSYWRGQSPARRLARDLGAFERASQGADLVYLSGISLAILPVDEREALLAHFEDGSARSYKLAFDPNIRPKLWESEAAIGPAIERMAAASDIIMPTFEDEAMTFADADAEATRKRYAALGVGEIVVKDGTRPTLFAQGDDIGACSVGNPVKPLDTTGAGDSFNGAYLAARMDGRAVEDAISLAQTVSACVVRHPGALVDQSVLGNLLEGGLFGARK